MAGLLALAEDSSAGLFGDDPCNPTPVSCVVGPCPQPVVPDHCFVVTNMPVPKRVPTLAEALAAQAAAANADAPWGKSTCSTPAGLKFRCGTSAPCTTADGRPGRTTDYLGRVCEAVPDQVLSMQSLISGTRPSVKPWVVPAVVAALTFAAWRWS